MSDFETRFGGIARLYGREGLARLGGSARASSVIGGVGTWTADGAGAFRHREPSHWWISTRVCVSNINRQLHALTDTVGRAKVEVMSERIRAINPDCRVIQEQRFFNEQTAAELLAPKFDYAAVDAIDSLANKIPLLANCRRANLPVMPPAAVRVDVAMARRCGSRIWPR